MLLVFAALASLELLVLLGAGLVGGCRPAMLERVAGTVLDGGGLIVVARLRRGNSRTGLREIILGTHCLFLVDGAGLVACLVVLRHSVAVQDVVRVSKELVVVVHASTRHRKGGVLTA